MPFFAILADEVTSNPSYSPREVAAMGSRRPSNAVPGWRVPTPRQFIRRSAKLSVQKRERGGAAILSGAWLTAPRHPIRVGKTKRSQSWCADDLSLSIYLSIYLASLAAAAAACATRTSLYHRALLELSAPSLPCIAATHRPPCFRVVSRVAVPLCRCHGAGADASPRSRLAAASPSPRCWSW